MHKEEHAVSSAEEVKQITIRIVEGSLIILLIGVCSFALLFLAVYLL